MDSIRVSEAPDPGSIPGEATKSAFFSLLNVRLGFVYLSKEVLSIVHLFKSKTGTSTSSYLYMIKKS